MFEIQAGINKNRGTKKVLCRSVHILNLIRSKKTQCSFLSEKNLYDVGKCLDVQHQIKHCQFFYSLFK